MHGSFMFERFTDRARRVIVHAQDEARGLQHNYIGTEHLLLGLLHESDGIAGLALARFGMSLAGARADVIARVGIGKGPLKGRIPFTPRAKKVLELALREALALGHNYIGTEHIVLGVAREAGGAGAEVMAAYGADMTAVREAVLDLLPTAQTPQGHRRIRFARKAGLAGEALEPDSPGVIPSARITCCSPPWPTPTRPPPGRSPRSASIWSRPGKHCATRTSPAPATSSPRKEAGARCWSAPPTAASPSRRPIRP